MQPYTPCEAEVVVCNGRHWTMHRLSLRRRQCRPWRMLGAHSPQGPRPTPELAHTAQASYFTPPHPASNLRTGVTDMPGKQAQLSGRTLLTWRHRSWEGPVGELGL